MLRTILRAAGVVVLAVAIYKATNGDIGGLIANILTGIVHLINIASDWLVQIWNNLS